MLEGLQLFLVDFYLFIFDTWQGMERKGGPKAVYSQDAMIVYLLCECTQ